MQLFKTPAARAETISPKLIDGVRLAAKTIVPVGLLALAGCSDDGSEAARPELVFDDLGGGSPRIQVYPGTTESEADRVPYEHTYRDGQAVYAACYEDTEANREVSSDPSVGERDVTSDLWFKLDVPGPAQYATAVYVELPEELRAQLDPC